MKISPSLLATSALFVPFIGGAPVSQCADQSSCFTIKLKKKSTAECGGVAPCILDACVTFDPSLPGCPKAGDTFSHICDNALDTGCPRTPFELDPSGGGSCDPSVDAFDGKCETVGVQTLCQEILGVDGASFSFVLKDGNSASFDPGFGQLPSNELPNPPPAISLSCGDLTCKQSTTTDDICGKSKGQVGKEKLWTFTYKGGPGCQACDAGVGGDPHFRTFEGLRYNFHGACDLVLLHNEDFAGSSLDIQVRTVIPEGRHFSYIQSVALKIGSDILEVSSQGHSVNGEANAELDTISGYEIYMETINEKKKRYQYIIVIGPEEWIVIRVHRMLLFVNVKNPSGDKYNESQGLLGRYPDGAPLARNGTELIKNWNAFGHEWQVDPSIDPTLFATASPHEKCLMPASDHRFVESLAEEEAQAACKVVEDFDDCVFDVVNTGDLSIVEEYF